MLVIETTASGLEAFVQPIFVEQESHEEEEEKELIQWKGKGKAVVGDHGDNGEITVDWTKYPPPEGLSDVGGNRSDLVTQIVHESIQSVKARIVEDEERRKAEKELEEFRHEEELRREHGKSSNIETKDHDGFLRDFGEQNGSPEDSVPALPAPDAQPSLAPEQPTKSKKQALRNLLRRLNNIGEKGESSATGAARHKRDISWSSIEKSPQAMKKRFVSEILKRSTGPDAEIECVSCLDDFTPKEVVKAPCHSYCKPCFIRLIQTSCENEQQWPPKCCLNDIPTKTIILNVNSTVKKLYHDKAAEWNLPTGQRIYCSEPNCSIWVRPYEIIPAENVARCSRGHYTCTMCRGPEHRGDNCPHDRDMVRTDALAEEEGWKRCYGCHAYVEHREACQHMTCRCGAEFCYVCGARWKSCQCTMEQLGAIKRRARERREARQLVEAQEEADTREALRLVEEFEREEALKLELLRRERERLAEERRERLLEERIRREGERRRELEIKFQKARKELGEVNQDQRHTIRDYHSKEESQIESDNASKLADLRNTQKIDREEFFASMEIRISERERELEREYLVRGKQEERLEEWYRAQLEAYCSRKPNGRKAKADAEMKLYKRQMDKRLERWEKWRNDELERLRYEMKEEIVIKEELLQEHERRLKEDMREEETAFIERKTAQLRWVDVVIEERERMLDNMEVFEIENGEDVEAWFDAEEVFSQDYSPIESLDLPEEFRVPGAFA